MNRSLREFVNRHGICPMTAYYCSFAHARVTAEFKKEAPHGIGQKR
jgi:hypothetical protein